MQIAVNLQRNVNQRMPRQLLHHMVKKAHPGFHIKAAFTVQIDSAGHSCFGGFAFDGSCAHGDEPFRNRAIADFGGHDYIL